MRNSGCLMLVIGTIGLVLPAIADIPSVSPIPQSRQWWMPRHEAKLVEIAGLSTNGGGRIVFIGDSITHYWEDRFADDWNCRFGRNSRFKALNLGYAADRTEHVLWRVCNGELDGYRPDVVVLLIGTNNAGQRSLDEESPADTVRGVKAIVDAVFEKQPQARILLFAIFPRGKDPKDPIRLRNECVNREISRLNDGHRVIWCDIGNRFLDVKGGVVPDLMPDYLHPSAEGYAIWAKELNLQIDSILVPTR